MAAGRARSRRARSSAQRRRHEQLVSLFGALIRPRLGGIDSGLPLGARSPVTKVGQMQQRPSVSNCWRLPDSDRPSK